MRCRIECGDIARIVGAHCDVRVAVELGEQLHFRCADDFIRDQHVPDAAGDQRLGLTDFLHAYPGGAQRNLPQGDFRTFMAFRVRPQAYVPAVQRLRQPLQVALESIELEHQARGIDFGKRRADRGGGTKTHGYLADLQLVIVIDGQRRVIGVALVFVDF